MGVKCGQRVLVSSPDLSIAGTAVKRIHRYGEVFVQVREQYSGMVTTVPAGFVQRDNSRRHGRQ